MNTKILVGIVIAIFGLFSLVAAEELPTLIDGHVYSGSTMFTPPVQGVTVIITCTGTAEVPQDITDADGYFEIVYDAGDCPLGSNVTACAGDVCDTKTVIEHTTQINILGFKLFDVPEFGLIAAGLALGGAGIGYSVIRRRKIA